jgi:predicted DNA-binding transcriptional regulator YafY
MNRVDRLLGYLIVFQSRELVRAQDLAKRFEVSERTVYRDIEALVELGVPIVGVAGEGYRLMEGYSLPPVMFSEAEAEALFLAIAMLRGFIQEGRTKHAAGNALEKVQAILPAATRERLLTLQKLLGFYAASRPAVNLDDERFVQLQRAIDNNQVVYLHYHAQHSNAISAREVEPLYLIFLDNVWLLHSYCRLRQDYRNFRLDRIDQLQVKSETFTPRPIKLPNRAAESIRVLVRFEADIVRWVRESQHITFAGDVSEEEDGAVVMAYHITVSAQFIRWLLGWGEQMEVLSPPEIREAIAQAAQQMAARHASPKA